ncbi:TetR/AcrR family transcriptional regulator [Thalassobacillus sp. CUG 92003]|uniref:TetR/AcrR family transcriptional regulator n=1 Tax=Thalassobacillus sp. CUG 92003 TaxID=2736641 RepID=UPI0015E79E3C|nr:TetR/AcrR family transcriptional regulator [Thalassobacillus sp. CUG 92003]
MDGFEKRKRKKMNNILHSAFSLFTRHGVQRVTIQEIAREAEVSQVTIYNYFGGKEQLVFEAIKTHITEQADQLTSIIQHPQLSFMDKLMKIAHDIQATTDGTAVDFIQSMKADRTDIGQFMHTFVQEYIMPLLTGFVEEGKSSQYIDSSLSNEAVISYFVTFYQHMARTPKKEDPRGQNKFSNDLTHMYVNGLIKNS